MGNGNEETEKWQDTYKVGRGTVLKQNSILDLALPNSRRCGTFKRSSFFFAVFLDEGYGPD